MDDKFDCIIVGGGVAGLAAAIVLATADVRFLLVERGEFCGAKNVSGGVLWGADLARLVPEFWNEEHGCERFINHRRLTFLDEHSAMSVDFKSAHWNERPANGVSVLRARFDNWLASKVQQTIASGPMAHESLVATNVLVDGLVQDGRRVLGIRTGEDRFYADCVLIAEGVNNLLTREAGLQDAYVSADHMAVGVKEVIQFESGVLEDRFQLSADSGMANEFVGFCNRGVAGGGFLYTNRSSVSVGLVLGMADLRQAGSTPYEMLTAFKQHPAVADMLRGGTLGEYSAHAVSTGDRRGMPKEVYGDGVLVAGEAAHLLLNAGRAIQGMDYAMRSGILAAETVLEARQRADFTAASLRSYRTRLEQSYVLKDMNTFQNAVRLLHDPVMHDKLPALLCDFGRRIFTIDNQPMAKASQLMKQSIRAHSSYWEMGKLLLSAYRSL